VSAPIVTLGVLVFCEYIPKGWFQSRPMERCRLFIGVLNVSEVLLRPFAVAMIWVSRLFLPGGAVQTFENKAPFVTREDLKVLAREGEREGVFSQRERAMLSRVFELSNKTAADLMVPRERMITVNSDTTVAGMYEVARQSGFKRIPVYDQGAGTFVGVVNTFHVLSVRPADTNRPVSEFMRPALLAPASVRVGDVFPRMRRSRQPMCLLTDEKSGVIGLVTTDDLLTEITGRL
jgi:CBS domain containing-hemolysin-like protein